MYGPARPCLRCQLVKPIAGRGLCGACYDHAFTRGEHIDYPRRTRRAEDVLQDLRELQAQGCTKAEICARLGMKWDSITRALLRLKQREEAA